MFYYSEAGPIKIPFNRNAEGNCVFNGTLSNTLQTIESKESDYTFEDVSTGGDITHQIFRIDGNNGYDLKIALRGNPGRISKEYFSFSDDKDTMGLYYGGSVTIKDLYANRNIAFQSLEFKCKDTETQSY
eukprot:Nk52_evm1s982 gene=Nk52_evmTU1s982